MQIDIYIREKNGDREIRIPLLPEEIKFPYGDAVFISNEIMGFGEVSIPAGTELGKFSWSSEFPGELRKNDPMIRGTWQDPKNYRNLLEEWKRKGVELNLLITGSPINVDVYCKAFEPVLTGAFGDIAYEVTFIQARSITITTSQVETQTTQRPTSTSGSYTIKAGDTLWEIAVMFYGDGTKWQLIYNANKAIIEKTAKDNGRSSSQNGHWIYPGVTLTIPNADGTIPGSSSRSTKKSSNNNNKKSKTMTAKDQAKIDAASREVMTAASNAVKQTTQAVVNAYVKERDYRLYQNANALTSIKPLTPIK